MYANIIAPSAGTVCHKRTYHASWHYLVSESKHVVATRYLFFSFFFSYPFRDTRLHGGRIYAKTIFWMYNETARGIPRQKVPRFDLSILQKSISIFCISNNSHLQQQVFVNGRARADAASVCIFAYVRDAKRRQATSWNACERTALFFDDRGKGEFSRRRK